MFGFIDDYEDLLIGSLLVIFVCAQARYIFHILSHCIVDDTFRSSYDQDGG